jgi:hypothetical protein
MAKLHPYDVFDTAGKNASIPSHHYEAYEFQNGQIEVRSRYTSRRTVEFDSRAEAESYLDSLKNDKLRLVIQLDPSDYVYPGDREFKTKPSKEKSSTDRKIEKQEENREPFNLERQESEQPQTEEPGEAYTGGSFVEDVEQWIPSLFEPAQKGIASLKNELDQDVDENNWMAHAMGASALDVLDTAMSFTQGIPLGLLDTRRIGEGVAKGTAGGVMEDVSRALNVLPQGRVLKNLDRAITGVHVVGSLNEGDIKSAAITGGLGAASLSGSKAVSQGIRNKLGAAIPPKGKLIGKPERTNTQAWKDSEFDAEPILEIVLPGGDWRPQQRIKSPKEPKGYTKPDYYWKKGNIAVENKRAQSLVSKENRRGFLAQAGNRFKHIIENDVEKPLRQWLIIDHRGVISGTSVELIHKSYWKDLGGNSVFEKIFIVTNDGIFMF